MIDKYFFIDFKAVIERGHRHNNVSPNEQSGDWTQYAIPSDTRKAEFIKNFIVRIIK